MTLNNKYTVLPTSTFKEEFKEIIYYIKHKLKEPLTAKRFYKKVINEIKSLKFMPEKYKSIEKIYNKSKILRKKARGLSVFITFILAVLIITILVNVILPVVKTT